MQLTVKQEKTGLGLRSNFFVKIKGKDHSISLELYLAIESLGFLQTRTESAQNLWLIKMPWTFDIYKNKN